MIDRNESDSSVAKELSFFMALRSVGLKYSLRIGALKVEIGAVRLLMSVIFSSKLLSVRV